MPISFNRVTWYSKLAAAVFFLFIFPIWCFYLGTQYQKTMMVISSDELVTRDAPVQAQTTNVVATTSTSSPTTKTDVVNSEDPKNIALAYLNKNNEGIKFEITLKDQTEKRVSYYVTPINAQFETAIIYLGKKDGVWKVTGVGTVTE